MASLLDPVQIAEIVQDPYERSHLSRFRPRQVSHGAPGSPAAQLAERIMTADHPDEIGWLRADLAQAVNEARTDHPAPRPTPNQTVPRPTEAPATPRQRSEPTAPPQVAHLDDPAHQEPERSRGLLSRLLRRNP
ncbi:hypothetical protein M2283_005345 [Streptomyces pseudovenezuelae]|uniref:Uncharacterized protein n=1 Tax=Streptomyces pseudovenezuelae TaxID=67350 RepID=A0ABT6LNX2_9ACTN|nr:hypothetical protein [Streptomyces pseudovenezuelae]